MFEALGSIPTMGHRVREGKRQGGRQTDRDLKPPAWESKQPQAHVEDMGVGPRATNHEGHGVRVKCRGLPGLWVIALYPV